MNRIEPRFVPPTISHGSGLSREHKHGPLQPMQSDLPRGEGRYLLALLVFIAIVGTLAAAALP